MLSTNPFALKLLFLLTSSPWVSGLGPWHQPRNLSPWGGIMAFCSACGTQVADGTTDVSSV